MRGLIVVVVLLISFDVQAHILKTDIGALDHQTDLEWMSLSNTNNQTYETIASRLGSGEYAGFRFATFDEITNLFFNIGLIHPNYFLDEDGNQEYAQIYGPLDLGYFYSALGITNYITQEGDIDCNRTVAAGYLLSGGASITRSVCSDDEITLVDEIYAKANDAVIISDGPTAAWLVRATVSEPSSLGLLALPFLYVILKRNLLPRLRRR